jgi:hypothetical protein
MLAGGFQNASTCSHSSVKVKTLQSVPGCKHRSCTMHAMWPAVPRPVISLHMKSEITAAAAATRTDSAPMHGDFQAFKLCLEGHHSLYIRGHALQHCGTSTFTGCFDLMRDVRVQAGHLNRSTFTWAFLGAGRLTKICQPLRGEKEESRRLNIVYGSGLTTQPAVMHLQRDSQGADSKRDGRRVLATNAKSHVWLITMPPMARQFQNLLVGLVTLKPELLLLSTSVAVTRTFL